MNKPFLKKIIAAVLLLILWEAAAVVIHNPFLIAGPVETVYAVFRLINEGVLLPSVFNSTVRILLGFMIGSVIGIAAAAFSDKSEWAYSFIDVIMRILRTIPVAAFIILLLMWYGNSFISTVISALVTAPIVYLNILKGLESRDSKIIEMADIYGIRGIRRFRFITLALIKPYLLSSLEISFGMSFKSGVAAEVIGQPLKTVGNGMYRGKIYLATDEVLAWTLVIILTAFMLEWIIFRSRLKGIYDRMIRPGRMNPSAVCQSMEKTGEHIKVADVDKAFGDHNVFKGVSFEVSAGDIFVILGASGSGKTTLLNMIAGLDKDYTGEIDIPGIKGMMFQEDRLLEDMSPAENVMIADPQLTEEEAVNVLRYLLPEDALHKPVKELSGGEKRRVAAVRAMEHKADFYLLDEPFTGLDVKACEDMVKYIDRKRGMAAVIITAHDEEDLPETWQQELKMFRL